MTYLTPITTTTRKREGTTRTSYLPKDDAHAQAVITRGAKTALPSSLLLSAALTQLRASGAGDVLYSSKRREKVDHRRRELSLWSPGTHPRNSKSSFLARMQERS